LWKCVTVKHAQIGCKLLL